jgi:hypothetical protein
VSSDTFIQIIEIKGNPVMKICTFNRIASVLATSVIMIALSAPESVSNPMPTSPEVQSQTDSQSTPLIDQLESAQENLKSRNLPIKIVNYTLNTSLQSDVQTNELENRLVSEQAIVPQYDGLHPESFALDTIQERMNAFRVDSSNNQNVVSNIQSAVFPLIKTGQHTLDITWESQGKQFHTTGIYDDKGIVYDNILSNIALVDMSESTKTTETVNPKDASQSAEQGVQSLTTSYETRALDYTIKWIWGGKRGSITVDHGILWNGSNYIYDQYANADYYMTLGSAQAQTKETVLDRRREAKIAYGYAWATPTADFSISFDAKKGPVGGSFTVSLSGVGSKGGGDDHHLIYLP